MNIRKPSSPDKKIIKINISESEINRRIDQIEKLDCDDDTRNFLIDALEALVELDRIVGMKNTTIARLRRIFEKQSEKRKSPNDQNSEDQEDINNSNPKNRGNNNGRNGKDKYEGADLCQHNFKDKKAGDLCPECKKGKLTSYNPGTYIRITGSAPLKATIHETEKLRCSTCLEIFEAEFEGKDAPKYDNSAKALIALFKYEASIPFYRLDKIQKFLKTPMPSSTQFDLMKDVADALEPLWLNFLKLAPDGELFYYDDTKNKVLSLIKENKNQEKGSKKIRKGIYTTGVISKLGERKMILYMTGRNYAGENLKKLLKNRNEKSQPLTMSDAARTNEAKEVVRGLCLAHARRKFVDLEKMFIEEVDYVLKLIGDVYKNDSECKEKNFSNEERLKYHQKFSAPLMKNLEEWGQSVFDEKKVEPNSNLGKSIQYLQKNWVGLTEFLRTQGMPLDNNILESSFRTTVLNRKNWLFYKTEAGALIGDIICSVIKTTNLCKKNILDYLKWVLDNREEVKQNPDKFMPWEFTK